MTPAARSEKRTAMLYWDDIQPGQPVDGFTLKVTRLKCAFAPSITLDRFAAHYDPDFARAVGLETVSLNTAQLLGLLDRCATDWAGSEALIIRHEIRIGRPAYEDYELKVSGEVTRVWQRPADGEGKGCAELACTIANQHGLVISSGKVGVLLHRRPAG